MRDLGSCLVTTCCLDGQGYGVRRRNGKMERIHRKAWEKYNDRPVPKGMMVLHHCDVRPCIREEHLFLGTAADNSADMVAKGRASRVYRGGNIKLSLAQVKAIHKSRGILRLTAERYGVSLSTVDYIRRGKRWKALTAI